MRVTDAESQVFPKIAIAGFGVAVGLEQHHRCGRSQRSIGMSRRHRACSRWPELHERVCVPEESKRAVPPASKTWSL